MILKKAATSVVLAFFFFVTNTAYGFEGNGLEQLKGVRSLKCRFLLMETVKWAGAQPKMETGQEELVLHFDSIDQKTGTARMIGNEGADDVSVLGRSANITIVERTGFGSFTFTTIYPDFQNGEFVAVHSRHIDLPNGPRSSQHHGTCKIWEK
jgi:hypothetical protein